MEEARGMIVDVDRIAKGQGLTQAEWCRKAGLDNVGVAVSRTYKRGDCKLSVMLKLLKPLGFRLQLVPVDENGDG